METLKIIKPEIDFILEELLELEKEIKPKVKRIQEIKDWCKQMGSFSTEVFVCSVQGRERTCLVSLDKAVEAIGREILERHNLIQVIPYQTVHVAEKVIT